MGGKCQKFNCRGGTSIWVSRIAWASDLKLHEGEGVLILITATEKNHSGFSSTFGRYCS